MSYILEALRKAERERSLGQVPTLEARGEAEGQPRLRGWVWVFAAALLVNAAVLAAWLVYRGAPGLPDAEEIATRELPLPEPAPPAIADYLPPPTTVIEVPISESAIATAQPEEPVAPVEPEPAPEPGPSADELAEEPAVEDTVVAETPLLRDLPAEFRRSLPTMKIDAHFYTDVPGRSFVMINLRKYKPGERLTEGPQVVEIVTGGVVLSYQGRQFLLTP